jgi:hypothetical protein
MESRVLSANHAARSPQERKKVGPYSRGLHRAAIGQFVDGRSREGRFLRAYEAMLLQHVGHAPTAIERALVSRAARLALYVELMDERSLLAGGMSDSDSNCYLAWSNALRRTLIAIGLKGSDDLDKPSSFAETLDEALAAGRAAREQDEAAL